MGAMRFVEAGYEIDPTPTPLPDGKFAARAVVVRQADRQTQELWPDFDPFATEAEAASAAHMAAVAWVAHQVGSP